MRQCGVPESDVKTQVRNLIWRWPDKQQRWPFAVMWIGLVALAATAYWLLQRFA